MRNYLLSLVASGVISTTIACSDESQTVSGSSLKADSSQTGVFWEANAATCSVTPATAGIYRSCQRPADRSFAIDAASPTANARIKALSFLLDNRITFHCESMLPLNATLTFPGGGSSTLGAGVGAHHDARLSIAYDSRAITISLEELAMNAFRPGCKLEVVALHSVPDFAAMQAYADSLNRLKGAITNAKAKIVPGKTRSETIVAISDAISAIRAAEPSIKDPIVKDNADIAKNRLSDSYAAISLACTDQPSVAACDREVNELLAELTQSYADVSTEVTQTIKFIEDEQVRLGKLSSRLAKEALAALKAIKWN